MAQTTMMVAVLVAAVGSSADATDFPALSVNAEVAVPVRGLGRKWGLRVGDQGCQMAKFDPSTLAQSKERKGSNFAA